LFSKLGLNSKVEGRYPVGRVQFQNLGPLYIRAVVHWAVVPQGRSPAGCRCTTEPLSLKADVHQGRCQAGDFCTIGPLYYIRCPKSVVVRNRPFGLYKVAFQKAMCLQGFGFEKIVSDYIFDEFLIHHEYV
jgi:hypothetical protein